MNMLEGKLQMTIYHSHGDEKEQHEGRRTRRGFCVNVYLPLLTVKWRLIPLSWIHWLATTLPKISTLYHQKSFDPSRHGLHSTSESPLSCERGLHGLVFPAHPTDVQCLELFVNHYSTIFALWQSAISCWKMPLSSGNTFANKGCIWCATVFR